MQQKQLAILEEVMKAHKHVQEISDENNKLKEKLEQGQSSLMRLNKLALSSASLLGSVTDPKSEVEPSSILCLSKLSESSAISDSVQKTDEDQVKLIVGKYLNQILAILIDFTSRNQSHIDIVSMMELEGKMNQLFSFGEEKQIIPQTDSQSGWKKGVMKHKELFDKIQKMLDGEEEESAAEVETEEKNENPQ